MMKRDLLVDFVITRLGLVAVALGALAWMPSIVGPEYRHISSNPLIDLWFRWDAGYFTRIGLHGYGWQVGKPTGDATFMPLYPLLLGLPLRLWPHATMVEATVVGVILSNACLLGALFYLDALLALDFDDPRLRRLARWLFLLAPATVFFSGVYTESLYFLLSLAAIYHARRERWAVAGLIGLLAGFTRVMGWTLALALAGEAWNQRKRGKALWTVRGAATLAPALPLPLYASVVGLTMGVPDTYFRVTRSVWNQGWGWPWRAFAEFFAGKPIAVQGWERSWLDLTFTLTCLALAVLAFRVRLGYGLYSLAAIGFPIWAGTLVSMPRYVAVAFPVYVVLAQWASKHRWRQVTLLALSALMAAFVAARFVTWHWIA
jgi:Gpi18-like mannosyltransferase